MVSGFFSSISFWLTFRDSSLEERFIKNQLKIFDKHLKKIMFSLGSGMVLYYIISIYQLVLAFLPNSENKLIAEIGIT